MILPIKCWVEIAAIEDIFLGMEDPVMIPCSIFDSWQMNDNADRAVKIAGTPSHLR